VYRHEVKTDPAKKIGAANDANAKTAAVDTVKHSRFEVIVSESLVWAKANAEVDRYKSAGLTAYIVTDAPGNMIKVSVGKYPTFHQADSARQALIIAGRISKYSKIPQEIKPK
jgi:hypothetical protein